MAKSRKRIAVSISSARSRLFELAELVRQGGDDTVVVFEQRGTPEGLALVRESRLQYLESRVRELDKAQEPFALQGSLKLAVTEDEFEAELKDIRRGWTRRAPLETE